MTMAQFRQEVQSGIPLLIIDVRTPVEYAEGHLAGAVNIPLDTWSPEIVASLMQEKKKVYLMCQSGKRAMMAASQADAWGNSDFIVVEGGMNEWQAGGGVVLVEEQTPRLSLMRQVHVFVGSIVCVFSFLAYMFNIHLVFIPMLVGVGLLISGLTGFCGLAMFLAKMPWNKKDCSSCSLGT